jgi:diguanylate cyclase (GGDEF)-like protein/PAS domain S-box-containing protein
VPLLPGGALIGRPYEGGRAGGRIAPLVVIGVTAAAATAAICGVGDVLELIGSCLLGALAVFWALSLPWGRFPAGLQVFPPLAGLAAIALFRDSLSGGHDAATALFVLPLIWTAFYGTPGQVAVVVAGIWAAIAVPALTEGAPRYPARGSLVDASVWLGVGAAVAVATRRLTSESRTLAAGYRSILDGAHESFISMDANGLITDWNTQAARDFGWQRDEVIGRELSEIVIPRRLRQSHRQGLRRFLLTGHGYMVGPRREVPALHRDGHEFPVEVTISALHTDQGYTFHAFLHDISARSDTERAVREAEELFRRAFDDAGIGMALVDTAGNWIRVNQALGDITGYTPARLLKMGFRDVTHPDDLFAEEDALRELVEGHEQRYAVEKRYIHADGHVVWIALNLSAVHGEHGEVLYLISQMQDITERRKAEERLAHQALHDPLTGIPNRILFSDRMMTARARLRRDPGGALAILYLDLDGLKTINDSLGHDAGDRLLSEVSARLAAVIRPSDTLARIGGDEFAVLCEGVDERTALAIAERLSAAVRQPITARRGEPLRVSVSIGIVLTSDPNRDTETLLAQADEAMYAAKQSRRTNAAVYRQPSPSPDIGRRENHTAE